MAEWVTTSEASQQTSYAHEHLNWLARKGKITARKSAGVWLIDLNSLKEYEKQMQELGKGKHNPKREDSIQC
jgi:hypothetical protein